MKTASVFLLLDLLTCVAPVHVVRADVCSVPTFAPALAINAGGKTRSVAVGDFNHDGKMDLAVVTSGGVSVLLGDGDANFQNPVAYMAGTNAVFAAVADLNGDGWVDLVVANQGETNGSGGSISVLLGNGDGTFKAAVNYAAGVRPRGVTVGDFNGDAKLDLAVANEGLLQVDASSSVTFLSSSVSVLLGNGDGTFQTAVDYDAGGGPISVAAADFNQDGKLDLAVSIQGAAIYDPNNPADVSILPGKGDGTFEPMTIPNPIPDTPLQPGARPLAIGDFNADGKPDLAVAYWDNSATVVVLGMGDGTFAPPSILNETRPPGSSSVAIGDFNHDGSLDLVLGGTVGMALLLGNGDGNFQMLPLSLNGASQIAGVAVADFNGDGKPDLVVADLASTNVLILLNAGVSTLPPANFEQIANVVTGGFSESVLVGDFNNDGKLDLAIPNGQTSSDHGDFPAVSVLLGKGGGAFQDAVKYGVASGPVSVAAGDFNGDGQTDLAVATGEGISVLMGKGDGTFGNAISYGAFGVDRVMAGDFNGDGNIDLATLTRDSENLSIWLGNGDGTFQGAVDHKAGNDLIDLVMADFNGDGKPDFAFIDGQNDDGSQPGGVTVLLGHGDGSFQPLVRIDTGRWPHVVAAGDFNGDGKPDLAVLDEAGFDPFVGVSILLGRGDGTFRVAGNLGTPSTDWGSVQLATGDVNGDAKTDLILAGEPNISIFLGNGDGTFQQSLASTATRVSGLAMGDFNGDGRLDLVTTDDRGLGIPGTIVSVWVNMCGSAGPGLSVERNGANISISWPAAQFYVFPGSSLDYVLEVTGNLTSPNWTPVQIPPTAQDASRISGRFDLTLPAMEPQGYFRLRRP